MNDLAQLALIFAVFTAVFIALGAYFRWLNTDEKAERERAKKDLEDMLKQADQEVTNRPRVRAINE